MARPRWFHHDGRPYDDFDFGKTRLYDELDAELDRQRRRENPISRWLSSRKGKSGRKRR